MTDTANRGTQPGSAGKDDFDLVIGKATDTLALWQQVPAWVLGGAAILGGACLIAFPKHFSSDQSRNAWAAVIVALFLAVLLSFRSALTLSADNGQAANPTTQPNQNGNALPARPVQQVSALPAEHRTPTASAGEHQTPATSPGEQTTKPYDTPGS